MLIMDFKLLCNSIDDEIVITEESTVASLDVASDCDFEEAPLARTACPPLPFQVLSAIEVLRSTVIRNSMSSSGRS